MSRNSDNLQTRDILARRPILDCSKTTRLSKQALKHFFAVVKEGFTNAFRMSRVPAEVCWLNTKGRGSRF